MQRLQTRHKKENEANKYATQTNLQINKTESQQMDNQPL